MRLSSLDNKKALAHTWLLLCAINAGFESQFWLFIIFLFIEGKLRNLVLKDVTKFPSRFLRAISHPSIRTLQIESRGWRCYSGGQICPFTSRSRLQAAYVLLATGTLHLQLQWVICTYMFSWHRHKHAEAWFLLIVSQWSDIKGRSFISLSPTHLHY